MNTSEMLTPADFNRPDQERRREQRIRSGKRIRLLPCVARPKWSFLTAELLDCSCNGIAIMVETEMAIKEHFLVPLKIGTIRLLMYSVRSCIAHPGGKYRIGAEFSGFTASQCEEDPAKILQSLLASSE